MTSPSSPSTPSSSSSRRSLARDFNYNDLSTLTASTASLTSTFLPQLHSKPNSQEVTTNAAVASRLHFLFLLSSLGLAAMAVLCKETGITVLGVACLYDLILHRLAILRSVVDVKSQQYNFLQKTTAIPIKSDYNHRSTKPNPITIS